MKAADIMTTEVISVSPETEVSEVARLLLEHHVSAVPVVDQDGHILGMVSEGDLMRRAECRRGRSWWLSLLADKTADFVRTYGTRARDVMTRDVVSIDKEADISEIARILEIHGIKRVPVLEGGRVVGIVSRADILRSLATLTSAGSVSATANDRVFRERILDLLKNKTFASLEAVSVIVVNGVVYLWGITETEEQREAVRVAAENVVGTGKVRNYLNTLPEILRGVG